MVQGEISYVCASLVEESKEQIGLSETTTFYKSSYCKKNLMVLSFQEMVNWPPISCGMTPLDFFLVI